MVGLVKLDPPYSFLRDLRVFVVNNECMDTRDRPPLTDSPWFWVLAFSLMALLALVAISGKYGRRQARLELQYQARERMAEQHASESNAGDGAQFNEHERRRDFATPGDTLIPLWPLAAILSGIALVSACMLYRQRGRASSRDGEPAP